MTVVRWYPEYFIQRSPDANFGKLPEDHLFFSWKSVTDIIAEIQKITEYAIDIRLDCNDHGSPCITLNGLRKTA